MSRTRALLVCPGRGSYGRDQLRSLQGDLGPATEVIDACDAWRRSLDRPTVRELDGAKRYSAKKHVAGEHASLLTFAVSLADAARIDHGQYDIVGVTGNSMGWYTALAVAGVLSLADAIELVETMGAYQTKNVIGGQVMMPVVHADWTPAPELRARIDAVVEDLASEGRTVEVSIELGSFVVLGADSKGIKRLLERLPKVTRGKREFPAQLPLHSAFHTSLLTETSQRAQTELAHLDFRSPERTLVDGQGAIHRPFSANPEALRAYTLGHQVVAPYDFATAFRTTLRECCPNVVIALGPGNSLGGPLAYGLVTEGWGGVRQRADLKERAVLRSFGIAEQRATVVA
ncbi:MAG: ACP S-malonyltransferase [Myxococcota bacterium]